MDASNGRDEPAPAANPPANVDASVSPPLPSSFHPRVTSSQQEQQQQTPRRAAAPPSPSPFARSAAASASLSPPLSPSAAAKRASLEVGNRAALRSRPSSALGAPQPSLSSRFSLGRVSFSRRGAPAGTATSDDNTLTMRLGQLLSVRKEEWSEDASLRQRSEEAHGKVREVFSPRLACFFSLLSLP